MTDKEAKRLEKDAARRRTKLALLTVVLVSAASAYLHSVVGAILRHNGMPVYADWASDVAVVSLIIAGTTTFFSPIILTES